MGERGCGGPGEKWVTLSNLFILNHSPITTLSNFIVIWAGFMNLNYRYLKPSLGAGISLPPWYNLRKIQRINKTNNKRSAFQTRRQHVKLLLWLASCLWCNMKVLNTQHAFLWVWHTHAVLLTQVWQTDWGEMTSDVMKWPCNEMTGHKVQHRKFLYCPWLLSSFHFSLTTCITHVLIDKAMPDSNSDKFGTNNSKSSSACSWIDIDLWTIPIPESTTSLPVTVCLSCL